MKKLVYLLLLIPGLALAQVQLQPGPNTVICPTGPTSTPSSTPTPGVIIGPVAAPPLLLSFTTAHQPDGIHAGGNQAWGTVVQQGVISMDLFIDGTFYPNPIAPQHTLVYTIGNPNGSFFWAPVVGNHQFMMKFYDAQANLLGTVTEIIPVLP